MLHLPEENARLLSAVLESLEPKGALCWMNSATNLFEGAQRKA